jgi:hypothetical protein
LPLVLVALFAGHPERRSRPAPGRDWSQARADRERIAVVS